MLDIEAIRRIILEGLPDDRERIDESRVNLDYYRGNFRHHRYRIADDPESRNNRSSLLMKKEVDCLTSFLYRDDPIRVIKDHKEATDFLQASYKHNSIWAKMQAADRLSMIGAGGAVAYQVAGTQDTKNPIKIHLWADHSFAVFADEDDPLLVEAVVTLDFKGKQERFTLYTKELFETYLRDEDQKGVIRLVDSQENPYRIEGEGILPFAFCHFETPVIEFHSGSIGNVLREVNDYIIYRLTELADAIKYLMFPIQAVENVDASWKPPRNLKPGEFLPLPAKIDASGAVTTPKIVTITASLGFVEETWTDLQNYINHSLECAGVPEAAIRMVQSVARSGSSIAAEQAQLVNYARGRQRAWLQYETELAKLVIQVAVAHLGNHGIRCHDLHQALDDFQLTVRWSPSYSAIPGPERDRADGYSVAEGYSSRIQVLQEREGMTRDEAVARLERVAEDQALEARILPNIAVASPQSPTPDTTPVADSTDSQDMEPELQN